MGAHVPAHSAPCVSEDGFACVHWTGANMQALEAIETKITGRNT